MSDPTILTKAKARVIAGQWEYEAEAGQRYTDTDNDGRKGVDCNLTWTTPWRT